VLHDNTALATEVEYEDHTSPSIWLTFKVVGGGKGRPRNCRGMSRRASVPRLRGDDSRTRGLAFDRTNEYVVIATEKESCCRLPTALPDSGRLHTSAG